MKIAIRTICVLTFTLIILLGTTVFAKYNYVYKLSAYSLSRDNSEIEYNISRTENDKEYTNQDVLLTINLNKEVEKIDGFTISEDRRTLSKLIEQNETTSIVVEDISGNTKEIAYSINNIDKINPEIIGVEDGTIYNTEVKINYMDNVGIKNVFVDRYSNLSMQCYTDYFDTNFYKGIDVNNNSIYIEIQAHPKNTVSYKYYINNILKADTNETSYTYKELSPGTTYSVKVEAIDKNGKVIESITKDIKTRLFSNIIAEKGMDSFTVTVCGVDPRISSVTGIGFYDYNNQKIIEGIVDENRNVTFTFSALDLTATIEEGYYFFHIHMVDSQTGNVVEIISCDVIFGTTYIKEDSVIDLYNLKDDGNYQIVVIDLAGNISEKNITIQK